MYKLTSQQISNMAKPTQNGHFYPEDSTTETKLIIKTEITYENETHIKKAAKHTENI